MQVRLDQRTLDSLSPALGSVTIRGQANEAPAIATPPIPLALDQLKVGFDQLEEAVSRLTDKLVPVCAMSQNKALKEQQPASPSSESPLSCTLQNFRHLLSEQTRRLHELSSTIEL